ncbi:3-deoxy-manno-octulosonate cytidylyltransferase [Campylobacter jejuni]|nr:3-deoxy-manno-octulosonate cytidylyltransferase [Campylobacter jejuni]
MKILGVIPARYGSTRFPGKPLVDILGKPMIWWVYQQAKRAKKLTNLIVATDDERIFRVCDEFDIPWMMTKTTHQTAANRLYEVSNKEEATYYIQINGDKPVIEACLIDLVIPNEIPQDIEFGLNLVVKMDNPVEVMEPSNIKVVFDKNGNVLYMSRSPIPFPYKSLKFNYYKHIGVIGYNKKMLDLYNNTKPGIRESIEGIDTLRFNDYGKVFKAIKASYIKSLSIDTPKDLEKVIEIIKTKFKNNELNNIKEIL